MMFWTLLTAPALASGVLYQASAYADLDAITASIQVAGRVAGTTTLWTWEDLPAGQWTFAAVVPQDASIAGLRYRHDGSEWISATATAADDVNAGSGPDGDLSSLLPGRVFLTPLPNLETVGTLELAFDWQQVLAADSGSLTVSLPLDDGGLNPTTPPVEVTFEVVGLQPITQATLSPEGDLATAGTTTAASWSGTLGEAESISLGWTEEPGAFGVELLAYRPALDPFTGISDGPGYGLLVLVPGQVDPDVRVDQLFTFVLDISDSMAGEPLETAKAAGTIWLQALQETDRFNVIPYASQAWPFRGTAPLATERAVEQGVAFLARQEASGLSDPEEALTTALSLADDTLQRRSFLGCGGTQRGPQDDAPPLASNTIEAVDGGIAAAAYVVLLTDGGASTGLTDGDSIARSVQDRNSFGASLYALGIGAGADTELLTRLARENRGEALFVEGPAQVAEALASLQERLADPLLVQPQVAIQDAWDLAPATLADLAGGHEILLAFRFDVPGDTQVSLQGLRGPEDIDQTYTVALPETEEALPVIARAWAQLRVRDLDIDYLAGDTSVYQEIEELVVTYGVASEVVVLSFGGVDEGGATADAYAMDSPAGCGCTHAPPGLSWTLWTGLLATVLRRRTRS
jgi:hypothetical protein